MVRVFVVAAGTAVFALLAFCESPPVHKVSTPTVGVFLDFDSVPGKASVEAMKSEVDALLKPSGVAVDWRVAGQSHGDESFNGLVVLKFKGKCKVEAWQAPTDNEFAPGETRALGSTQVENGHVLPFSEVKCDAVKQALSYLNPAANQSERQKALGLAMGRVVAHELYHILARTTAHAAHGLAKAAESLPDLVSTHGLPFRAEESEAIRKGVLQ
jgi:hypothetical protein